MVCAGLTMADDAIVNGVVDYRTVEGSGEEDHGPTDAKASTALMQQIAALEQEKEELAHENDAIKERAKKLIEKNEALESDKREMKAAIERSEADNKALESIAARAAALEAEVSRLQHDLITSMSEGQEVTGELADMKRLLDEMKRNDSEKKSKLEVIEKERNLLLEKIDKDKGERVESENQIRELKKKIEAMEVRESNLKSERIKVEEEAKAKIDEKENEARKLKKMAGELDSIVMRHRADLEKSKKEKEELEIVKNELEALLKKSERKVKEMEQKAEKLQKELEVSQKMVDGGINGKTSVMVRRMSRDEEKGLMGLKQQWPLVAASASAIALVAVVYLRCVRQS